MVKTTNPLLISSNTVLNNSYDNYIVDATQQNISITLPVITSDGMNYLFNRIDPSPNSVIISGPNLINGATSGYDLSMGVLAIESYNNVWYIYIYNEGLISGQLFPFSLTAEVLATTGYPAVMSINNTNPPVPIGGLVPAGTGGYFDLTCSPWYVPWDNAVVTRLSYVIGAASVTPLTKTFPMFLRLNLIKISSSTQTLIATGDLPSGNSGATAGSPTGFINTADNLGAASELRSDLDVYIPITRGLYGIEFGYVNATNYIGSIKGFYGAINIVRI